MHLYDRWAGRLGEHRGQLHAWIAATAVGRPHTSRYSSHRASVGPFSAREWNAYSKAPIPTCVLDRNNNYQLSLIDPRDCSPSVISVTVFQFQLQLWFFSYSFSYSYVVFLFIFQLSYRYSYRFSVYISVITFSSFSYSFIVTLHEICICVCKENTIATLVLRFYYTARKMGKNPAETKD